MRLAFDIETDGLLRAKDGRPPMTTIWCLVTEDLDTGEVRRYHPTIEFDEDHVPDGTISEGVVTLAEADLLVPHNGVGFDIPAVAWHHGYDLWAPEKIEDTLVLSHLIYPRIGDADRAKGGMPKELIGRHSLAAWGHRLGVEKGDYGEHDGAFDALTPGMVDYCALDVAITAKLWKFFRGKLKTNWGHPTKGVEPCVRLEHRFARQIAMMMDHGFPFDKGAAEDLLVNIERGLSGIDERIHTALGPREIVLKTKTKVEPVNLGSAMQVTDKLVELYGWRPTSFTATGRAKFDDAVVAALPDGIPIRGDLQERQSLLSARKRLLGDQKKEKSRGLIQHAVQHGDRDPGWWVHHYCNHNGARTGRCTHSHPNVNFPRVTSKWGPEFRGMVKAPGGWCIVGCDMSGVDARMIAHYLAPLDNGAMVNTVLEGGLHDRNRELMATVVPDITRSTGKNVFYAVCYGAKAKRVGLTAGGYGPKIGGQLRRLVRSKIRGLESLIDGIEAKVSSQGWIRGLDGRVLVPDAAFSALNTLSQGGAAVVMKEATALVMEWIQGNRIDAHLILHVHDEGQILCRPADAGRIGEEFVRCIVQAGETWGVRCPLDGEYKVGASWAETH